MFNHESRDENREGPKWARAKEFKRVITRGGKDETLIVVVATSDHKPHKRYSVKSGVLRTREGEDNNLFPFINPYITNQNQGKAEVDDSLLMTAELLREAHEWIKQESQDDADAYVEAQEQPKDPPKLLKVTKPRAKAKPKNEDAEDRVNG